MKFSEYPPITEDMIHTIRAWLGGTYDVPKGAKVNDEELRFNYLAKPIFQARSLSDFAEFRCLLFKREHRNDDQISAVDQFGRRVFLWLDQDCF